MFLLSFLFLQVYAEICYAVATGGRKDGHYTNTTQIVDFLRNSHAVKKAGDLPQACAGHSIVAAEGFDGRLAFVLGGRSVGQTKDKIFGLDSSYEWTTVGTLVEAREGHVSINYGEYIYTCGGQQNSKIISSCEKSAASIVSGDKWLIFGGQLKMGYTRSVESISLSDLETTSSFSFEDPLPVLLTESAALLGQDGQVFITGGFNHSRYSDFGREEIIEYGDQNVGALPGGRRMHSVASWSEKSLIVGDYDARPESKALLFENGEITEYRLTGYSPNALMATTTVCFPIPI
ncbi:unnamed protein product [Oikopleura dioica]|uniref:Uncharacterized protein n=1 Tax=Oikopleura dioica TaxID=34765 RepID=E4YLQ2_OIKDI|nr:unnamed protein product [Oikopleura dioica]